MRVDTFLFFQLVPLAFTGSAVLPDASAPSTCDAATVDLRRRCTQPAGSDGSKEENHQEDSSLLQIKKSTAQVTSLHKFKENWWTSQHRTTANDMKAFSHISHNVDCDVREAAKWYSETLGFVDAYNIEDPGGFGSAYWPKMGNTKDCIICVDICSGMGATDGCLADFKWIWHPGFNLYFELIQFHVPKPKKLETGKAWDLNGWRHIALEVENATDVYYRIKDLPGVEVQALGPPGPLAVTVNGTPQGNAAFIFFYWKDKFGVFWEMEQGRQFAAPLPLAGIGGGTFSAVA